LHSVLADELKGFSIGLELGYNSGMTLYLNDEQRHAIEAGQAVEIAEGSTVYCVLSKAQFDRLQSLSKVEDIDPSLYEFTDIEIFDEQR
jgi:hypothetical protein